MENSPRVFVVEQDPDTSFRVQQVIPEAGFAVGGHAGLGTEAVAQVTEARPDVIMCGFREPAARTVQTIESLVHLSPETPVIAYSEDADLATVRKAMVAGARDFLQAPLKPEDVRRSLSALLAREERRHLRSSGSGIFGPEGAIVTVFGAKGGVGKTTLAANLGVALRRRAGQAVALVDADDTFGDSAAALALTPDRTVADAVRNLGASTDGDASEGLKDFLTMHESGLAVLATPRDPLDWQALSPDGLKNVLRQLARNYDLVLVDTGGNLSEISQAALEVASLVLWVTTPDYASVRDSLEALDALQRIQLADESVRIVLNLTSSEIEVSPRSIEDALGRQIFWTVPYDRALRQSAQAGQTVFDVDPKSGAALNISDLARLLSGVPSAGKRGAGGPLRRMFGRKPQISAGRQAAEA